MSDFPTSIITNQTFLEVVLLRLEQILCSEVLSHLLLKMIPGFMVMEQLNNLYETV